MHVPVLLQEVLEYLNVEKNKNYIDCTLGAGGYTEKILEANAPKGKVFAFELDPETIRKTSGRLKQFNSRLTIINDNFGNILNAKRFTLNASGIVYDLGLSRDLLETSGRGFSFQKDEPLDMRMDPRSETTAEQLLKELSQKELAELLFQYGGELFRGRIARNIKEFQRKNKLDTTQKLVEIIEGSVPARYRKGKIHCATRTFQALRIVINNELEQLERSLKEGFNLLERQGRIVVVSFHSLEDRIVKLFFRKLKQEKRGVVLTKKPITPSREEILTNPASRSAKLRVIQKI